MQPKPELPSQPAPSRDSQAATERAAVEAGDGDGGGSLFDIAFIGVSDQACKECRRRKAKCNKALPTCDVCSRYRRHCLYEKNARTPLTRKHLTEVEARLERAEAVIKQLRTFLPPELRTWGRHGDSAAAVQPATTGSRFDFSSSPTNSAGEGTGPGQDGLLSRPGKERGPECVASPRAQDAEQPRMLEQPPVDDFEWCEMDEAYAPRVSSEGMLGGFEEDMPLSDGMASLSVNESEGGYLGVASGAALLRILEPAARRRASSRPNVNALPLYTLNPQPNPNRQVAEAMIDAYFRLYHASYPMIHEPTFRAQYSEVIPRPNGPCWTVLAYVVAAIGVWTSSLTSSETLDLALFSQARALLTFNFLELGNLTLVQGLALSSNYLQKRNKPNSGYNYMGLAVRMAMGLGLHKEFQGWKISPLTMEIRRRVWWTVCVFDVGATITFSRPDVWPYKGVEVSFPMNVNDKDLTAASETYPAESNQVTPYTAVATQARFHIAAHECYEKVICKPFPLAEHLLKLDANRIKPWEASIPSYFSEQAEVAPRYALSQAVMAWRKRNLRIIMYRPFVIRTALRRKPQDDPATETAINCCLDDAKSTIYMISKYWASHEHNRLAAWYALYFLFQAALIPCICLRNDPASPGASDWREQIVTTLRVIRAMRTLNASSARSYRIIEDLCGRYLEAYDLEPFDDLDDQWLVHSDVGVESQLAASQAPLEPWLEAQPVGESPQTQINNVFSMMWPNVPPMEAADEVMGDEAGWMQFLRAGSVDDWPAIDS